MAYGHRGGLFCAGLLACGITFCLGAPAEAARSNCTDNTHEDKSALVNLALRLIQKTQSQQNAALTAIEDARQQAQASTRRSARLGVGLLLVGAMRVYVLVLLRSIQRRTQNILGPARGPCRGDSHAQSATRLLARGEELLRMKQPASAVGCFDAAIALDEQMTEAFLKKATALERLKRLDEALACYDRAIKLDASLLDAYVGKGTVSNRLQRYREALECYERACRLATGSRRAATVHTAPGRRRGFAGLKPAAGSVFLIRTQDCKQRRTSHADLRLPVSEVPKEVQRTHDDS